MPTGWARMRIGRAAGAALLFCMTVGMMLWQWPASAGETRLRRETVTLVTGLGRHAIVAEIADDPASRATGLMFRSRIGPEEGMLFLYEPAQPVGMWMRNTYISLDMVFIAPGGRVVRVEERTEPLSERLIESGATVAAVLELEAGAAYRLGLKPGDQVETQLLAP